MTHDDDTIFAERIAQQDLDLVLKREEILWKDKAKTRWIDEGDANTRCFHRSTIIHRKFNVISSIQQT